MQNILPTTGSESHVMALFADRVLSFALSKGATLADLVDRLDRLDKWRTDRPTAVYLKFGIAHNHAVGIGSREAV
jgi:hypothetical protein